MSLVEVMRDYYARQRIVAVAGALVAVVLLLLAWWVAARSAHPFGITIFLIAGAFTLPANIGYFFYVGAQSARIRAVLAKDPAAFRISEAEHLDNMMQGFLRSYWVDGAVALLGTLTAAVGVIVKNGKWVGIGLALALCASTLLAGEIWSRQRALHYQAALQAAGDR